MNPQVCSLAYLLTHLLTHLLTYLHTYLLACFLTYTGFPGSTCTPQPTNLATPSSHGLHSLQLLGARGYTLTKQPSAPNRPAPQLHALIIPSSTVHRFSLAYHCTHLAICVCMTPIPLHHPRIPSTTSPSTRFSRTDLNPTVHRNPTIHSYLLARYSPRHPLPTGPPLTYHPLHLQAQTRGTYGGGKMELIGMEGGTAQPMATRHPMRPVPATDVFAAARCAATLAPRLSHA